MTDLITPDLVRLDANLGDTKQAVIRSLAEIVADAGRSHDAEQLAADAFAREETSATGLPGGIAIPHCRTAGVDEPTLAFARLEPGVDFGAKDGPADLAFLIAAPAGGDADHLQILTQLARALVKPAFTDADIVEQDRTGLCDPDFVPDRIGRGAIPADRNVELHRVSLHRDGDDEHDEENEHDVDQRRCVQVDDRLLFFLSEDWRHRGTSDMMLHHIT